MSPTTGPVNFGVYKGAVKPAEVASFASWLGGNVGWALDFFSNSSWSSLENPSWWLNGWAGSRYTVVYSVPMLPASESDMRSGAAGAYDDHWAKLAQNLVAAGQANAVLRLGWEFNGGWYRWSAKDDPAAFAAYWRQIVTSMRAVPGARFRFDWCPTLGPASMRADQAYPGNDVVDFVGADVYDQGWETGWQDPLQRWKNFVEEPYGLQWQASFASRHGKPITFPEWGLSVRSDGHGGGDNPYFVERMREWIGSHDVAYALYFDYDAPDGGHSLTSGQFPLAAAKFRSLFGAAS